MTRHARRGIRPASLLLASALATAACTHGAGSGEGAANSFQNWSEAEARLWHDGSQGSRLIPKAWLLALEAGGSQTRFMEPAHFERFGYIWPADRELPIGFATDLQSDDKLGVTRLRWYDKQGAKEPWVGLNCAACHTAQIDYTDPRDGTVGSLLVNGAPTLADFQGFTESLYAAMEETRADPEKWSRFAASVLGRSKTGDNPMNRALLATAFDSTLLQQRRILWFNETTLEGTPGGTRLRYGHGRLDAVGHILNKVALMNVRDEMGPNSAQGVMLDQLRGMPDAPVSYPFIWNIHQHDFVQWNGLVPNQRIELGRGSIDAGALVRNTSEVMGVFADVTLRPRPASWARGYRSSVNVRNLDAMELQLSRLKPPAWPAGLGPILDDRAARGKEVFATRCASCHVPLDRDDLTTPIKAQMIPVWGEKGVGTDPWMMCNAYTYRARSGAMKDVRGAILKGEPYGFDAPTNEYLKAQAIGVLLARKWDVIRVAAATFLGNPRAIEPAIEALDVPIQKSRSEREAICRADTQTPPNEDVRRILAYKSRPLTGIWATAPYLHNGSVRTLYQLLLPPDDREPSFWVGSRQFDAKEVGYQNQQIPYSSEFRTRTAAGQPIHGNSNAGHDYGNAGIPDDDRWALVEYMKTL